MYHDKGYPIKKLTANESWVELRDAPINPQRITVDQTGQAWIINTHGHIIREYDDFWILQDDRGLGQDIGISIYGVVWFVSVYGIPEQLDPHERVYLSNAT